METTLIFNGALHTMTMVHILFINIYYAKKVNTIASVFFLYLAKEIGKKKTLYKALSSDDNKVTTLRQISRTTDCIRLTPLT